MRTYCTSIIIGMIVAMSMTSCIYDAPGDRFYRTLWESDESPFGEVTLEFLCNDEIVVTSTSAAGSYGTYEHDGTSARFTGLTLTDDEKMITIYEGHRNDDILFITWTETESGETGQTQMHRLSAYK